MKCAAYPSPAHRPDSSVVRFTYTATGRRATVVDGRGTTTYASDLRARLVRMSYPDGRRLDYNYDALGNRISLAALIGTTTLTTTYSYDAVSRLATLLQLRSVCYR